MSYLEGDKQDKRQSLKNYFPEYQSSFTFLFDYRRDKKKLDTFDSKRKVGGYAFGFSGEDYHYHIRESLDKICSLYFSKSIHKVVVDTAPVLDRDLAYRSGLGWFGKNSMLINRHVGSYFMIGHVLLNKKFNVTTLPMDTDHCGQCRKCIDACPTDAIIEDSRTVDSNKCIPFFTIEKFKDDTIPPVGYDQMSEVFGCDICQEVCPWNERTLKYVEINDVRLSAKQNKIKEIFLDKSEDDLELELQSMSKKEFVRQWKKTSFERTGRDGVLKNIKWKKKVKS